MNKRWPTAIAAVGVAWYASDSLRHRREQEDGYRLRGEELDVGSGGFLRATEAITSAPISYGNDIDLLINGDRIFPSMIETIAGAQLSVNLLTYIYWSGEIARTIAGALCERAKAGVEVNVLLDAVGSAKMDRGLVEKMDESGVTFAYFRPPKPYALRRVNNRTHRKLLIADGTVGMT
ncbi:MAG: cardiolipin synthase, partial [Solirubrobacteraceae bacterium]|nr:cardiolipin synthase [Solirubrobacteraceae bacterium]